MDKENINHLIFEHLNVNFLNNNIQPKTIKSGYMFSLQGPASELGFWSKESNYWKWTYNSGCPYFYKFFGIEPKYLNNKKWAMAGLTPSLMFNFHNCDYKIVFHDNNNISCQHFIEHLLPETVVLELKNYISTLKITEANTYFKQFNFNPEQIKTMLNSLISEITNNSDTIKIVLPKGSWLYAGKSPKNSLPTWFFVLDDQNYYIEGYNWIEGDEPKFNESDNIWLCNSDIAKEFKSSSLPDYLIGFLIDKKIIEGSSYESIIVEDKNKNEKNVSNKEKLSLYERALKGEFKQQESFNTAKTLNNSFSIESEFVEEKELEYKNFATNQDNKVFQLSFDEVEAELLRINAKNLFDDSWLLKKDETESKVINIAQNYSSETLFNEYEKIFINKVKEIIFSIIKVDERNKSIHYEYLCSTFDNSGLTYEKVILFIKNPKKTSYFKINDKNFSIEKLTDVIYIITQKVLPFSISEKFIIGKLIEELKKSFEIIKKG